MVEGRERRWAFLQAGETKENTEPMRSRSAVIQHLWVLGLLVTWLLAPSCGGGGAGTTQSLSVVAAAPLDPSGNSTTFINMATSDQLLVQV